MNTLHLFYFSFFTLLMYLCFVNNDKGSFNFYFWIQLVEIIAVIILNFQVPKHRSREYIVRCRELNTMGRPR